MTDRTTTTEMMRTCFSELMKSVGTSIPGQVLGFDSGSQLAQVQVGVERVDINGNSVALSPITEVPVYFPGGDFCVEYQIDAGNEGLILFSQRCIDAWVNQGGTAPPPIRRFHDMSDALFIPGFRSQANKMSSFQNNGVRLRDKDGTNYIWLKNDGTIAIQATAINIVSNLVVAGDMAVNGGTITNEGVNVGSTHVHGGVTSGPNNTSVPS